MYDVVWCYLQVSIWISNKCVSNQPQLNMHNFYTWRHECVIPKSLKICTQRHASVFAIKMCNKWSQGWPDLPKGSYTLTVSRHTFYHHLLATSMHQQHMCLILLKVEQSSFTQAFFSNVSGVHECSDSI